MFPLVVCFSFVVYRKLKIDLAFKMLGSARPDLIPHALQLLPATKITTVSEHGLTPLMIAAINDGCMDGRRCGGSSM